MEHIEIDHIEVSDSNIEVRYWVSGYRQLQQVTFKTRDFENWLAKGRDISINAYWDHWDSYVLDDPSGTTGLGSVILYQDMKRYLGYRFKMFNPPVAEAQPGYVKGRKPMSRVSKPKKGSAETGSA